MIMSHFSQKAVSFYTLLMAKISTNHLKYGILTLLISYCMGKHAIIKRYSAGL